MSLCEGKKSDYWNLSGQIVPIDRFPNKGGYHRNGERFFLPKYDTKQPPPSVQLYACSSAVHFTNLSGYHGITSSNMIKVGIKPVDGVHFAWFSLIPEVQQDEGLPSPGVTADASRYGRFKWTVEVKELLAKFQNPVIKVLGTHVYQLEVMYALLLCEENDDRFTHYPLCPDVNAANSIIQFTVDKRFLWSPYTKLDETNQPWDHLALAVPQDVNIANLGTWGACGTLYPNYAEADPAKEDVEVYLKIMELKSMIDKIADAKIAGLNEAMADAGLDAVVNALTIHLN